MFHDTTGTFTGFVLQTVTIRENFERFRGFAVLDAMKRELNYILWLYMEIVMHNELKIICLDCEEIFISERKEVRKALNNFV